MDVEGACVAESAADEIAQITSERDALATEVARLQLQVRRLLGIKAKQDAELVRLTKAMQEVAYAVGKATPLTSD